MSLPSPSSDNVDSAPAEYGRSRLWLVAWLARRPDVMARLVATYQRLSRTPARHAQRLTRRAGVTLAGAALLLALAAGALFPPGAQAATINVDSGVVIVANDNKCSLAEAILNANSNNQVFTAAGECAAGSGADVINLPGGGAFYLLTAYGGAAFYSDNGLPLINSDVTIEGNGAKIERDSTAPKFRVLAVSSTGNLKLNNTTISGGSTDAWGGGIYVSIDGRATLTGSTIFGNGATSGGGIASKLGALSLTNSTVSGNTAGQYGGGLHINLATVTLANSTVSGNTAGNRGGGFTVFFGDVMTVNGSTIRGNTAGNGGGAIYHIGGTVALTNSTISDNTSTAGNGGGILNRGGSTTVTNSTITANSAAQGGGGLHEEHQLAQVSLVRSLISGNSSLVGDEIHRAADSGPITANARNVFGHAGLTGADAFENFTLGATDFNATSSGANVPLAGIIGYLDNNGGPTFTHALVPGSPAIDFASSAACATITDQRGYGRNVNGDGQSSNRECDSGAVEFNAILATPSPIASSTPTMTNTPTPSITPSPSTTPSPTIGPSPTATSTATEGPSPTPTHTVTPGPSPTPSRTLSPTSTATAGPSPSATLPPNLDWQVLVPIVVGE